ncbi:SMP-30/Gluconolaconase/LRE-like region-containing protein [Emticicia oligotrophica DSM 17448]|uniref:SMP-30/Gluconolaconase/LRE-like region-containing protein n=2 Tax=Emticicia TaxID=312278 RepID=A0ABN4AQ21_EMTOG|nr:SMP-30/Gluconolaconase/LRE-like region-containing protein [Emticicia oligotrophica DSM 17448]
MLLFFAVQGFAQEAQSKIIAKGATLTKLSGEFAFTEGPAADAKGNVFFTDQPNDKIYKWSAEDNTISVFMDKTSRSNGLYFDHQGNLLSCADLENQLISIDKNQKITVLVNDFEGKKFNGPNDLWVAPNGGIYFTDPFYKRPYWKHTEMELPEKRVYYLSPDKRTVTIAAREFVAPNGIIGTPDGKTLYVADISGQKTYTFPINSDGTLGERKLFAAMGSDGMTLDKKGNVYVTGKGVTVFDKNGTKIEHIDVKEPWTANVTFGGKDRKTLFITASKSVYTLKMKVKGA